MRLIARARTWARGHESVRRVAMPALGLVDRVRTRGLEGEEVWRRRLPAELTYWRDWMASPEAANDRRLDPGTEVWDTLLRRCLELVEAESVDLLDVGAGPFTVVGFAYPGKRLRVTAVDPLADDYARLIAAAGLRAPVPTTACAGEALVERFGPGRFDVVHARNALDHSFDPGRCIREMADVARIGGYVALKHHRGEAESQHYHGLHQHNFDVEDGSLVVWGRDRRVTIDEICPGRLEPVHVAVENGWVEYLGRRVG